MDERGRKKEKIRFRNTIDPEFSRLRRALNWLKPTGIIGTIHGCILMASAVTIILSFKRTFLEGQSYSSRITPNFVIGMSSLAAGVRAICIKSQVGFSLDKPALKCVIGFCGVSTFVSLAMSVLLICLSAYEYHTLIYNPPNYSFIGDRIALNLMNLVVSCISTVVCVAMLTVYVSVAIRIPMAKHHSPNSTVPATSTISVISNGSVNQRPTCDSDIPDTLTENHSQSYVNGCYTSKESLSNGHANKTHVGNGRHARHLPPFGVSQYAKTNIKRRDSVLADDNFSLGSSDTSIPTHRGMLRNDSLRNPASPRIDNSCHSGSGMPGYARRSDSPKIGNTRYAGQSIKGNGYQNGSKFSGIARDSGSPIIVRTRNIGTKPLANENPVVVHVRNLSRSPVNLNMKIGEVERLNMNVHPPKRNLPDPGNGVRHQTRDTLLTIANRNSAQYSDRPYLSSTNRNAGYSNSGYDSGFENQNISEWRGSDLYGVKLDRSPRLTRNSDA